MCLFCNSELETLDHLFTCPSLSQQWVEISKLSLQFLRSITSNLRIKAALPSDFLNYLPRITTQPSSVVWSPIQYLAKGIFPAFILDDLWTMKLTPTSIQFALAFLKMPLMHSVNIFGSQDAF